jgi:hypothetical protein
MGDKFTRLNYILNIFYKTYVKIDDNLIQEPYTGLIHQKKTSQNQPIVKIWY